MKPIASFVLDILSNYLLNVFFLLSKAILNFVKPVYEY